MGGGGWPNTSQVMTLLLHPEPSCITMLLAVKDLSHPWCVKFECFLLCEGTLVPIIWDFSKNISVLELPARHLRGRCGQKSIPNPFKINPNLHLVFDRLWIDFLIDICSVFDLDSIHNPSNINLKPPQQHNNQKTKNLTKLLVFTRWSCPWLC